MSDKVLKASGQFPANTLFVGVDIAKKFHFARAHGSNCEKGSEAFGFTNDRKGFNALLDRIELWRQKYGGTGVVVGMEPTGNYWRPLEYFLKKAGFEVCLVSPLSVSRFKDAEDNSPLKSDGKDALLIAKHLRMGAVLTQSPRNDFMDIVKKCIISIEDMNKVLVMMINLLESYIAIHFPNLTEFMPDISSPTMMALLEKFPTPKTLAAAGPDEVLEALSEVPGKKFSVEKIRKLCDDAAESIGVPVEEEAANLGLSTVLKIYEVAAGAKKQFVGILRKTLPNIPSYPILRSVRGIGMMTAATIIAFMGDLGDYDSAAQVLKKAGLNLFNRSSGSRRGNCHISRRGKGLLRKNLYMACLVHTRKDSPFYGKYTKLRGRHFSHRKAMVALMRKILKISFALVRKSEMFDPVYEAMANARVDSKCFVGAEKNQSDIRRSEAA